VAAFFSSGGSASTPWCGGCGSPSSGAPLLPLLLLPVQRRRRAPGGARPPSLDLGVLEALGFRGAAASSSGWSGGRWGSSRGSRVSRRRRLGVLIGAALGFVLANCTRTTGILGVCVARIRGGPGLRFGRGARGRSRWRVSDAGARGAVVGLLCRDMGAEQHGGGADDASGSRGAGERGSGGYGVLSRGGGERRRGWSERAGSRVRGGRKGEKRKGASDAWGQAAASVRG
jgi:hypothetical protein